MQHIRIAIIICIALLIGTRASAQVRDTVLPPPMPDTTLAKAASPTSIQTRPGMSLQLDTLAPIAASTTVPSDSVVVDLSKIQISSDGLTEEIAYAAKDSMWFDVTNKQVHLYGEASVKYTSLEIKAGYILLDYAKNEVTASMFADSSGQMIGPPEFKDKDQSFTANKLRYNFKSKKGIIYEARTKQEDLFVLGQKAKFIGAPDSDTTGRNTIYNYNALITTCNADHPHFGVRTKKLKVIPDKLVVTGFSNVELAGIPTPLVLPFGFYPITKTRKAGLIIPQDFNFAEREGLGLQDFGWYQPINEHMDVKLLFSAFVNGSVGVAATTNYNYKYKSAGNVVLRYNRRVNENTKAEKVVSPSFGLQISHRQDPNAHPTRKISGSVNIETNRDQNRNQNDFQSVYRNQLQSNFTLNKIFPGKPYQFNLAFTHNQNTQTRKMNITLPEATFTLQRIYPFKRQNGVGKERWYEKLSLVYNSQLRNSLSDVPDTSLFTRKALQNIKSGIQHKASTDFNMKLAKFINITPNLSYEENWYPYIIDRQFDPTPTYKYDSVFQVVAGEEVFLGTRIDSNGTKWGRDTLIRKYGFNSYRNFNASIGASTSIFGTVQFRKGWLKGIRHKISPSISMGYSPDYSQNTRIFREVSTSSRPGRNKPVKYSIFDEGIYSKPSSSPRSMILSYSLLNVLEIKHFSKRDTTGRGKKTKIFDNLNFSGNYNFSADSLNWSTIGTNGVFRFFKGLTTLNWRLSFDPYDLNTQGRRINTYNINNGGGLLRLDQFGISVNTGLSVRQLRDMIEGKDENAPKTNSNPAANNSQKQDDFLSWFDRFNLTHTISYERQYVPGTSRDTFLIGFHNLSVRGDIPVSSKWTLNISNISYDFQDKEFVFPDFGITRDLHCWQMSLSWQPARGTYFFTINAKPGTFQFLKVPYRQNNFDAQGGF